MPLPEVNYTLAKGGLGQQLPGTDYYSGKVFWCADNKLPSGFSTSKRIIPVFQIQDAEALGILADYSDETPATGTYLVTGVGATGDIITITSLEPNGKVVVLATYTRLSTDTTAALVAAGIKNAINALTGTTGYSVSLSTATVTITARKGLGIFVNSGTPLVVTITGTIAGTLTQYSGGVASLQAVWHYHIDWFFKKQQNNQGVLYLYFNTTPGGTPAFTEISDLQVFTNGKLKQIGLYQDFAAYASSHLNTIQGVCTTLESQHMGVSVFYSGNLQGTSQSALTLDLGTLTDQNVTVDIGQDGAALGNYLFTISGKSIGSLGAMLGTTAAAAVSQSIAEVGAFNVSDGTEFDTAAFSTGELVRNVSQGRLDQLNDYGYTFLRKFMATTITTGTYFNGSRTAISLTSDYCFIERVRTIDKAKSVTRDVLLPLLGSRIPLNADGTMQQTTVANIQTVAGTPLNQMVTDGDISAYQVVIDPAQKILVTGILYITLKIVPVGIAKTISVTIGYVPKL
jgi:hypothetical protein